MQPSLIISLKGTPMIGLLATILVLLALVLTLRAMSYRHTPSSDPVVIDMIALREYEEKSRIPVPVSASEMPMGPDPSSPFDQGIAPQLPTGPPPRPSGRARPAGSLPGPDPPRPVGALLTATTSPPTYGAAGLDAYCP
jgi:hypothetical protein